CLVAEVVLTFFFLMIIMGSTDKRAPAGLAPIAIGLGLTLIHLIGIPVTNLSVNPARSTEPAIFVGGWALSRLWVERWQAECIARCSGNKRQLGPGGVDWLSVGGTGALPLQPCLDACSPSAGMTPSRSPNLRYPRTSRFGGGPRAGEQAPHR